MGQKPSFEDKVRACLYAHKKEALAALIGDPDFTSSHLTGRIFVELLECQVDNATIMAFAKVADDDQLATLIGAVVLNSHVLPLGPLFARMKDRAETIRLHNLKPLFLIACDRTDTAAVTALVEAGCFDAADPRPITTVVRREVVKKVPDIELLRLVLTALPGHDETVKTVLENYIADGKYSETVKQLKALLRTYIGAPVDEKEEEDEEEKGKEPVSTADTP